MNESEQAQTIAEIKRFDLEQRSKKMMVWEEMAESADGDYVLYVDHKAIVDSQAQKIAHYEAELKTEEEARDILGMKIAEQAKEISAQNVELINLRYNLQTARIQAEGVRADIICGETSYLRQYLDGHEFPWEKTDSKEVSR